MSLKYSILRRCIRSKVIAISNSRKWRTNRYCYHEAKKSNSEVANSECAFLGAHKQNTHTEKSNFQTSSKTFISNLLEYIRVARRSIVRPAIWRGIWNRNMVIPLMDVLGDWKSYRRKLRIPNCCIYFHQPWALPKLGIWNFSRYSLYIESWGQNYSSTCSGDDEATPSNYLQRWLHDTMTSCIRRYYYRNSVVF